MVKTKVLVTVITSLLLLVIPVSNSFASLFSYIPANSNASSGFWASSINTSTGTATNAPYTLTWTGNNKKQDVLVALINSGTFDLNTGHFTYGSAKPNGDTTNAPVLTFDICSGIWDSLTFTCSGTTMTIGNGTSGTVNVPQVISPGNRVVIRITNARNSNANFITTLNSFASRTDIRTGVSTHS